MLAQVCYSPLDKNNTLTFIKTSVPFYNPGSE